MWLFLHLATALESRPPAAQGVDDPREESGGRVVSPPWSRTLRRFQHGRQPVHEVVTIVEEETVIAVAVGILVAESDDVIGGARTEA